MAHIVKIPKEHQKDGKPRYKVRWRQPDGSVSNKTFRLMADANAYRTEVENNTLGGVVTSPKRARRLVKDVAKDWQEYGTEKGKRPNSLDRDETIIRLHIEPQIGSRHIGSVTEEDVQALVNRWGSKYAPRTVDRHYAVLRAIFAYAVRKRIIPNTPCTEIGLPEVLDVEHPVLTGEQLENLGRELGADQTAFMWLGVEGFRWGEAAGLTADRLTLTTGRLTINRQLNRKGQFAPVKTKRSNRSFAMTSTVAKELTDLMTRKGLTTDDIDTKLFTAPRGGHLHYSNWRLRIWVPACNRAGLPGLDFHDLRSLAATTMIAAGVDMKTTEVRLGHNNITTTADIYARQSPEADRLAAVAISGIFQTKGTEPRPLRALPDLEEDAEIIVLPGGASKNRTCDLSIISAAL